MHNQTFDREQQVRRADLNFRAKYIDIPTTIYRIDGNNFIIWVDVDPHTFESIEDDYEGKIRPMTVPARLSRNKPANFECIVSGISDNDIPKNFAGMSMNSPNLYNLVLAKFPKLNIQKIENTEEGLRLTLYNISEKTDMGFVRRYATKTDKENLLSFLQGIGFGVPWEIVEVDVDSEPKLNTMLLQNEIHYINAPKLLTPKVPEYQQRDEALWFDNIDQIFEGNFGKAELYFMDKDDYSCYIDYTSGGNINIRNFLLLYKTVYITPPFETDLVTWINEMFLSCDDFLFLIEKNRIRIMLTQYENRYGNSGIFNEIYRINPNAIITRRAIATLQQIDVNEIADNYFFSKVTDFGMLQRLAALSEKMNGIDAKFMYEMLTWPIRAKRQSFEALQWSGTFALPSFGVNNFASIPVNQKLGKNLDLEFSISSGSIHLAHAMNATYFPYQSPHGFSDQFYAHMMGSFLNIFKNTTAQELSLLGNESSLVPEYKIPLNPIEVLVVNEYVDIPEFEQVLTEAGAFPKGAQLMEHLAGLSTAARAEKIAAYNLEVSKNLKKTTPFKKAAVDLSMDVALDGLGLVSDFAGVGTAFSLLKIGSKQLSKIPEIKKLNGMIESAIYDTPDKQNIHFLTKINRVARVKKI